jgi:hypothetical protein
MLFQKKGTFFNIFNHLNSQAKENIWKWYIKEVRSYLYLFLQHYSNPADWTQLYEDKFFVFLVFLLLQRFYSLVYYEIKLDKWTFDDNNNASEKNLRF